MNYWLDLFTGATWRQPAIRILAERRLEVGFGHAARHGISSWAGALSRLQAGAPSVRMRAGRLFLEAGGTGRVPLPVGPRVGGRSSRRSLATAVTAALLVVLATGCASYQKRKELQAVARDWCFTIRASQVLPVYPLTEDLQPGDVFPITAPFGQEARLYSRKGFLPLDQHLVRLQPLDFGTFYQHAYNLVTNSTAFSLSPEQISLTLRPIRLRSGNSRESGQRAYELLARPLHLHHLAPVP